MAIHIVILWILLGSRLNQSLKQWTKPTTETLAVGTLADMTRSRRDLVAENALLRQQLIVLRRQVKRPKLTNGDRIRLVLLACFTRHWQNRLHIVQPDPLLRWHRDLSRLYWRRKSRKRERKQRIPQETIDLIKEMAAENHLWGAERIRGELLKLGIKVSKRTVQRYLPKRRRQPGQTWATFLKNHAGDIWACDFTVVYDLLFLNRQQLQRTVSEYVDFYNHLRPHQGLGQHIPDPAVSSFQPLADGDATKITSTAILGGLHHSYSRAPNLH
jgi:hypothetical protein